MIRTEIMEVLKKEYQMFKCNLRKSPKGHESTFWFSNLNQLFDIMLSYYVGVGYIYELPAKGEVSYAHIGKERQTHNLIYTRIQNVFGLPTYDDVRVVFICPKEIDTNKIMRRIDTTICNLYEIQRIIKEFLNKIDSNISYDSELKKIAELTKQGNIDEARERLNKKRSVELPGQFIGDNYVLFKNYWIEIKTDNIVIATLIRFFENNVFTGYTQNGEIDIDFEILGNLIRVVDH